MSVTDAFEKIKSSIAATAIVALHQARLAPDYEDADDYVETMTILESLISRSSVDHRDIVARLRHGRPTTIDGRPVKQGGNRNRLSQVAKLREHSDPMYMARSGITDGAAMHVLGPALFFRSNNEMISSVNFISRITHSSDEASLAAILVALRIRQACVAPSFEGASAKAKLLEEFHMAACKSGMVSGRAYNFMRVLLEMTAPMKTQREVIEAIGLLHVATSTPVAAVACSFRPATPADQIYALDDFLSSPPRSTDEAVALHRKHFSETHPDEVTSEGADYMFANRADVDTFSSILLQIRAIAYPLDDTFIKQAEAAFFEDWNEKVCALAERGWG